MTKSRRKSRLRCSSARATVPDPVAMNRSPCTRSTAGSVWSRARAPIHGESSMSAAAIPSPTSMDAVNATRRCESVSCRRCTIAGPRPRSASIVAKPTTTTASATTPKSPGGTRRASRTPTPNCSTPCRSIDPTRHWPAVTARSLNELVSGASRLCSRMRGVTRWIWTVCASPDPAGSPRRTRTRRAVSDS